MPSVLDASRIVRNAAIAFAGTAKRSVSAAIPSFVPPAKPKIGVKPAMMRPNLKQQTSLVDSPVLRFSPWSWAKLLFLCDMGPTEIGGFGIASPEDSLFVEDISL